MAQKQEYVYLFPVDISRIKNLSDSIFSVAMTLLTVSVIVPDLPSGLTESRLTDLLLKQWPDYLICITSFMNISSYWLIHYNIFGHIIDADKTLIRWNLLLLLSVMFLPFPARLMSKYGREPIVDLLYGGTISFSYLFLILITWHAYTNNRLTRAELCLPVKRILGLRMLIPFGMAVLATICSFSFPKLSFLLYTLVSLFNLLPLQLFLKEVTFIKEHDVSK